MMPAEASNVVPNWRTARQHHRALGDPAEHARLGLDAAGIEVVGDLDRMQPQDAPLHRADRAHRQPGHAQQSADAQAVLDRVPPALGQVHGADRQAEEEQRQRHRRRRGDHLHDAGAHARRGVGVGPAGEGEQGPAHQQAQHEGDRERPRDRAGLRPETWIHGPSLAADP
jgi:hypothetical protein